jgi:hypothetical protein
MSEIDINRLLHKPFFPRKWIESGLIVEGTKLITFGAETLNLEKPCSPLEVPTVWDEIDRILTDATSTTKPADIEDEFKCVFLKLHANSTRRALW